MWSAGGGNWPGRSAPVWTMDRATDRALRPIEMGKSIRIDSSRRVERAVLDLAQLTVTDYQRMSANLPPEFDFLFLFTRATLAIARVLAHLAVVECLSVRLSVCQKSGVLLKRLNV